MPDETKLPSSAPPSPESSSQPQTNTGVGVSPYDGLQSEVKALQQQAMATQMALKKLQTHAAVDPVTAVASELPVVDGVLAGTASVLLIAIGVVWWYLWHRPQAKMVDAAQTEMPDLTAESAYAPVSRTTLHDPLTPHSEINVAWVEVDEPEQAPAVASALTPYAPPMGFDPEAAATEVIRVRKSLADKREARFNLREPEGPANPPMAPSPPPTAPSTAHDPWSMPGDASFVDAAPLLDVDIHFSLPDTWPEPDANNPLNTDELDLNIDEPDESSEIKNALEATSGEAENTTPVVPTAPDFAITLALAQESEALELWGEARDLATEVLAAEDANLQSEARALLDRLCDIESQMGPETTGWSDLR